MTNTISMLRRLIARGVILCSLLAVAGQSAAQDVVYYHTDALGTPIAMTDSNGDLIGTRREFEPYGRQLQPTSLVDGPGFSGHVSDAVTGLSYMQQRYYDPKVGRFLSVDPVTAYENATGAFNRYWYAYNNPYRFTDPDGREAVVKNGRIWIRPVDSSVPAVNLPNNVGAVGFRNSMFSHEYNVTTRTSLTDPLAVGNAIANNPTPGNDERASPMGTVNNVGHLPFMALDGGTNMVRSYLIASPDPTRYTDITVNYTIDGQHSMEEGFVMKFGEIGADGTITLRSYGEGDALPQVEIFEPVWDKPVNDTWQQNHREIIRDSGAR